jgi:hypothetical protein
MPNSPSPVFLAENRSWSYWFADGLPQLLIGISAMLFGFYFISMTTPASTVLVALSFVAFGAYLLSSTAWSPWSSTFGVTPSRACQ